MADDTPVGPATGAADRTSGGTTTDVADAPVAAAPAGEAPRRSRRRRGGASAPGDGPGPADAAGGTPPAEEDAGDRSSRAPVLPLVPALSVLLVLLLAGCIALWATRPGSSAVRTDDYVGALQAARSGIVDVTSFDYVTLDEDIEQIRDVTTGDLKDESVDQLDQRRQQITDAQAVVNTEVVGAAVGSAGDDEATVFAVLQSTQQTSASQQAQVQRFRVEIKMTRVGDRWLLSGITGR